MRMSTAAVTGLVIAVIAVRAEGRRGPSEHVTSNRFGSGDDVKGAIVFPASEASCHVSSAGLVMDGGFMISAGV